MIIRSESESDYEAITRVTEEAFRTLGISRHTEQFIITALRSAGDLTVSLVAETDGRIIGHIAFSPVAISDGSRDWYGLGPISVLPEYQKKGIGSALIHEGFALLKKMNAAGCLLVGDPEYYKRFGFRNNPDLVLEGVPTQYFLALAFKDNNAHGTVKFHSAFSAES